MTQPTVLPRRPDTPAEAYERFFVPAIFAPWAGELLRRAAPRAGERAFDLACGTGAVARHLAPLVGSAGRVVGLARSPEMLAVARGLPSLGGAASTWCAGDAATLPFADGAFDLALCQQGLQFVADRATAARELRRVLAPGGRTGVVVWRAAEHNPFFREVNETLARHTGGHAPLAPFSLGDEGELRSLLTDAGFRDVTVAQVALTVRFPCAADFLRLTVLSTAASLPGLTGPAGAGDPELVGALGHALSATLRAHRVGRGLAVPTAAQIAFAKSS